MKDHETHRACNKRIAKEGGKTQCCDCVPHEDCGDTHPKSEELESSPQKRWLNLSRKDIKENLENMNHQPIFTPTEKEGEWEKGFTQLFRMPIAYGDVIDEKGNTIMKHQVVEREFVKSFIRKTLAQQLERVKERIEECGDGECHLCSMCRDLLDDKEINK